MTTAATAKRQQRAAMRARLSAISAGNRSAWSASACDALMGVSAIESAGSILGYAAMPKELDLGPLLRAFLKRGVRVCLPSIDWEARTLEPAAVGSLDGLVARQHGVPEPAEGSPIVPLAELDAILVPGLAFDTAGGRLGRGAGFYDRLLSRLGGIGGSKPGTSGGQPVVIGVCFGVQVCDAVPVEDHDRRMDATVTEAGVVYRAHRLL